MFYYCLNVVFFFNQLVQVFLLLKLYYVFWFDYDVRKTDHRGFVNFFLESVLIDLFELMYFYRHL